MIWPYIDTYFMLLVNVGAFINVGRAIGRIK